MSATSNGHEDRDEEAPRSDTGSAEPVTYLREIQNDRIGKIVLIADMNHPGAFPVYRAAPDTSHVSKLVKRLQRDCAEAYQVVGSLASYCGMFEDPQVIKALDNLSAASDPADPRPHDDLLPFTLPSPGPEEMRKALQRARDALNAVVQSGHSSFSDELRAIDAALSPPAREGVHK